MKRLICLAMALILLLSLAACDAQYSSQSSTKKKKTDKDAVISDTSNRVSEPEASETQPETEGIKGKPMVLDIQTDSMLPTFAPGDRILCEEVDDPTTLQVGDIITYWAIINGERVMNTHRINAIYDCGGFWVFETKGDNKPEADPLTVHQSEIIAKFIKVLE